MAHVDCFMVFFSVLEKSIGGGCGEVLKGYHRVVNYIHRRFWNKWFPELVFRR